MKLLRARLSLLLVAPGFFGTRCWLRWRALKQLRWPNQSESLRAPHCHFDSRKPAELYTAIILYGACCALVDVVVASTIEDSIDALMFDDDGGDPPDRTLIFGAQLWWTVQ